MRDKSSDKIPVYKLQTKDKVEMERSFQELEKDGMNEKDIVYVQHENRVSGQQYHNSYMPNVQYNNFPPPNTYNQPYPGNPQNNYQSGYTTRPRPLTDIEVREKKRREGLEDEYNCDFCCGLSIGLFFGILAFLAYCFNPTKQYKKGIIIGAVIGVLLEIILIIIILTV